MGEVKKVYLTWDDVNRLLDLLYDQVKGGVDLVTGIPRGGTLLAIMFSHRFKVEYSRWASNHYPRMLILDDIADSGNTIAQWEEDFHIPMYGTLHYKESSIVKPDYFANGGDRKTDNTPEMTVCEEEGIQLLWNVGGGKIQSSSTLVSDSGMVQLSDTDTSDVDITPDSVEVLSSTDT